MKKLGLLFLFLGFVGFSEAQCIYSGLGIEAGYVRSTLSPRPLSGISFISKPVLNSFSLFVTKKSEVCNGVSLFYRAGYIRQGFESSENIHYEGYPTFGTNLYGMRFHQIALDASLRYALSKGKIKPYLGFGMRSTTTVKSVLDNPLLDDPEFILPNLSASNFRKFDLALLPAIGIEFGPQWKLETSMSFGMFNALKMEGQRAYYNRSFSVSLGYSLSKPAKHYKHRGTITPVF